MMAAVLILWLIGAYLIFDRFSISSSSLLKSILGFFFSFALLSICYTFSLFLNIHFVVLCAFLAIWPIMYIAWHLYRLITKKTTFNHIFYPTRILVIVFATLLVFTHIFFENVSRWGDWDGWAIWSLHARFLVDETYFSNLFTNQIAWTHPDYPLLLPAGIAMLWKDGYTNGPFVPMLISLTTGIGILLILLSAFLEKKFTKTGLFIFCALGLSGILFPYVSSQLADSLLGLFFLISFILYDRVELRPFSVLVFLLGFFCACCPLIKNEGFPFFLIFSFFLFLKNYKQPKLLIQYLAGAFIPLSLSLIFKFFYAPDSDIFVEQTTSTFSKITDPARHHLIFEYIFTSLSTNFYYMALLLVFAAIFVSRYFALFSTKIILLTFACYYFIYLITPNDLLWHMTTSLGRLLHQVFPALLYSALLAYNIQNKTSIA